MQGAVAELWRLAHRGASGAGSMNAEGRAGWPHAARFLRGCPPRLPSMELQKQHSRCVHAMH